MKQNTIYKAECKLYERLAKFWEKHLDNILVEVFVYALYLGFFAAVLIAILLTF